MHICPVCGKENTSPQCACGFDLSRDYEGYPTLALLPGPVPSRSASAAELKDYLHCGKCGSLSFRFHLQRGALLCSSCGAEQALKLGTASTGENVEKAFCKPAIALGDSHILGLRSDGRLIAAGDNRFKQCNVKQWTNMVAIAAYTHQTLALRKNGTVLASGYINGSFPNWTDITAIAAGDCHILGVRRDGTVLAEGENDEGQCHVSHWRDIIAVAGGDYHSVGLKKDGTVVAVGDNAYDQCDVYGWNNVIAVAANFGTTYGLRKDGTLLCTDSTIRRTVSGWQDIAAIDTMFYDVVGLKKDGTVVTTNKEFAATVSKWNNVVSIAAGVYNIAALLQDGTVVVAGSNECGQCNVSDWKLL